VAQASGPRVTAVVGIGKDKVNQVRNDIRRLILNHEDELSQETRDVLMQVYEWFGK
jgi:hypothetical protein